MEYINKFVDFKKYCETCMYRDTKETEDPCHGCLDHPVNLHSHKPVNYEERPGKKGKNRKDT